MTYTKPQIAQLGNASKVIQGKKVPPRVENSTLHTYTAGPAYELDE
jgi:hypothetical protein